MKYVCIYIQISVDFFRVPRRLSPAARPPRRSVRNVHRQWQWPAENAVRTVVDVERNYENYCICTLGSAEHVWEFVGRFKRSTDCGTTVASDYGETGRTGAPRAVPAADGNLRFPEDDRRFSIAL